MNRPPRAVFTSLTGWEADYRDSSRHAVTSGYRGPFPASANVLEAVSKALAPAFNSDDLAAAVEQSASADRLIIEWGRVGVRSIIALRHLTIDGIDGWLVIAHGTAPEQRGTGRLRALLRLAVRQEPADIVVMTEADDAVRHALRGLSPTRSLHPRPQDSWEGAIAIAESLDSNPESLCVADMSGVISRRSRTVLPGQDRPSVQLKRIAVTGTNGKTSCVELGRQLMTAAGRGAASFGTLGITTERGRKRTGRIGPGPAALPRLADRLWALGEDSLWLEAFSNALGKGLLDRMAVDVAIFTQLGVDHVSVHGSLAGYQAAKERLFTTVVKDGGTVVLDPTAHGADRVRAIADARELHVICVGAGEHVELTSTTLRVGSETWQIELPFAESIMVRNLELVIGAALACGLAPAAAAQAIEQVTFPPGRFMEVSIEAPFRLVIEAGHNGDALQVSLKHWRSQTTGRLLVLLASVGSSDTERWEPLGEVADVLADVIVVTDESPYGENSAEIRAALRRGCPRAEEIPDRIEAIEWLLDQANDDDMVLLMGRADEAYVIVRSGTVAFPTDEQLVRQILSR